MLDNNDKKYIHQTVENAIGTSESKLYGAINETENRLLGAIQEVKDICLQIVGVREELFRLDREDAGIKSRVSKLEKRTERLEKLKK